MPQFYFNLHEPAGSTLDTEGLDLASFEIAYEHAVRAARGILAADVAEGHFGLSSYIAILDAYNVELVSIPFPDAIVIDP